MRPQVISKTGAGTSDIAPININNVSGGVALAAVLSGTATYTIEHTYDNIYDSTVVPTWWPHGVSNLVSATSSQEGNFVLPVTGCRINIASGSGTVTLTVLQQGII